MVDVRCAYVERSEMRQWQLATLQVQQQLQKILDQEQLISWCGGGTLLGAVRDNGFLYWDNDLDMFFLYREYRDILVAFWRHRLLDSCDIYYNVDGYWERHTRLCSLLLAEKLDEDLLDFELNRLSDTMFKVFAKETIPLRLWNENKAVSENLIKIKHFTAIHLTRERKAKRDDSIVDGELYEVYPNVCMLPMLVLTFGNYLRAQYSYVGYRNLSNVAEKIKDKEKRLFADTNGFAASAEMGSMYEGFDLPPHGTFGSKVKLALRNFYRAHAQFCKELVRFFKKEVSGRYVVYRQGFFRFQVLPCPEEYVLPLQKIPFEGGEINVPNNPDAVLTNQFGNYRMRPSLEQRIAYPFFIKGRIS